MTDYKLQHFRVISELRKHAKLETQLKALLVCRSALRDHTELEVM